MLILVMLVFLSACESEAPAGSAFSFFPTTAIFEQGFAAKYYNHYQPTNKDQEALTRISYILFKKIDENRFYTESYNAAFEYNGAQYFQCKDKQFLLDSANYMRGADTLQANIKRPALKYWASGGEAVYEETYDYNEQKYRYKIEQKELRDTLINGNLAKYFLLEKSYIQDSNDSLIQKSASAEIFVEGIGYWSSWEESTDGIYQTELVEQMPLEQFYIQAQHGEKRVAYIDPKASLGEDSGFKLCGPEKDIADYYNGDPDAGYLLGKKEMMRSVEEQLDANQLQGQNGMLTFRFVISCEGKAGRFITEEFDFDYQRTAFSTKSKEHLLEILLSLKTWQPTVIRGEKRDSYAYKTFKILNGEIIDILP
jgi:hypothetical protein